MGAPDGDQGSFASVRKQIERNGDQKTEVATIIEEMTETEIPSAVAPIVESQESREVSLVGKGTEPSVDLETLPKGESDTLMEAETPALSVEEKPPVTSTKGIAVEEKPDEKKKTASVTATESKLKGTHTGNLILQLGAFRDKTRAEGLKRKLAGKGYDAYLEEVGVKNKGIFHRVRIRCCSNEAEAKAVKARLKKQGFGDALIVGLNKN